MKAQSVWFLSPGHSEIREHEVGDPQSWEIQVRCVANGICMGDVSMFAGHESHRIPLPRMVGHEGIGVVTKVGRDVNFYREGEFVVCREWATVQNLNAWQTVRFARPPADPALYFAEPAECVVGALYSYDITPGDRVLLMGAGFMGLLNVQGLAHYPLGELVVTDIQPRNLAMAREFGATRTIQVGTPAGDAELDELRNHPFDLVIEACGAASALQKAGALTRHGGRLSIFAWHHEPRTLDLGTWHLSGLKVLNSAPGISRDRNINNTERAVRLLERGIFDLRKLVTHRHSYQDVQQAMETAVTRPEGYIKGVLLFDGLN
jgi:threonine dehydrogenase-like Zn-dependent dehydrogenase